MDLDELQTVKSRERQTDSLQQLRDSFYTEASEYIQQLRDARDRAAERADNPWSDPEVGRLSDEIETAEQTVEAIHKRRVAKIVKNASLAAHGSPVDDGGLTAEEREMFERLVADIEANREHVLDKIAGELPADATPGSGQPDSAPEPAGRSDAESAAAGRDAPEGRTAPDTAADSLPQAGREPSRAAPDPAAPPSTDQTAGDPSGGSARAADEAGRGGADEETVPAADVMNDGGSARASEPAAAGAPSAPSQTEAPSAGTQDDAPAPGSQTDPVASAPESQTEAGTSPESQGDTPSQADPEAAADGSSQGVERRTVRITADVGAILGVDQREYDLSADDVVTLPEANAKPLLERDAAQPLD
ncbi:DNA replication complex subunit Gins51 [Halapricum hydrolyticum]|uniref:Gins51 C-terminal domain-containing protein n=1 Tax=Halapricum hydrolyticum TaxID=2979991 RepID=A0AAE3LG20_9EURY|nr:hypothetical protein [Halapricum hydrolyticum]MCU4719320.1 hypothetical protein [Halapricum hydrolyticum]MCU4728235.1 hypothetical protein [Halapricum hydrolyticum]